MNRLFEPRDDAPAPELEPAMCAVLLAAALALVPRLGGPNAEHYVAALKALTDNPHLTLDVPPWVFDQTALAAESQGVDADDAQILLSARTYLVAHTLAAASVVNRLRGAASSN
jgi:hypothetical protein